jgi:hypothetical protein
MVGELGLNGAQQTDLGGDFGGQVGERGGGVVTVEIDRRLGSVEPLEGPVAPWWL